MSTEKAQWRRCFDVVERAVTPRVEAAVRTETFAKGAATTLSLRSALRSRVQSTTARLWHTLNLPAGSDVMRLRAQLGAMDRDLRRLSARLDDQVTSLPQSQRPTES